MVVRITLLLCLLTGFVQTDVGRWVIKEYTAGPHNDPGDHGDALFLTPMIRKGRVSQARTRAKTGSIEGENVPSYSGYLTVNKSAGSNLFFWFFPNQELETAPIILWLQGGPGKTSLFGLFVENGPYVITPDMKAHHRKVSWSKHFHMLYIDNPVGTGYSFTESEQGYATNQDDISTDLFEALQQFFTLFKEYSDNQFFIAGEAYAGKYVPALAHVIHTRRAEAKMKLTGLIIGNGLCDPVTMLNHADFLLQTALVSRLQSFQIKAIQEDIKAQIEQGNYVEAFKLKTDIIKKIKEFTGASYLHNYLLTSEPSEFRRYESFVQTTRTRKAIHVGSVPFSDHSRKVAKHLEADRMRSVKHLLSELLEHYQVLIYTGQLDIVVAPPMTLAFVDSMEWSGARELTVADRTVWRDVDTFDPLGYVRRVGKLTEVMVAKASRMVAFDRPKVAFEMIERFINRRPF